MWIMWIKGTHKNANVKKSLNLIEKTHLRYVNKIPQTNLRFCANNFVELWIYLCPNSFSPIITTSPAPIVINKSPELQFSKIKVSISSKDGM